MCNSLIQEDIEEILLSEEKIAEKVRELGEKITKEYQGKELMIVGILKGSNVFMSDLIRKIPIPLVIDFMVVSSYGNSTETSGVVRILKDLEHDIKGKNVLIVEDIIDTGLTLEYLKENLLRREPQSLKICTLLDKPSRRKAEIVVDYKGFEISDRFIVGYGIDFAEKYRNLPFVGILRNV